MHTSIRTKKLSAMAAVAGALIATAGCGGGGHGTSANLFTFPPGLTTIPQGTVSNLPANMALLPLEPGDEWYYSVGGIKKVGGTTQVVKQGIYIRTIGDASTVAIIPPLPGPGAPLGTPGTTSFESLTGITEQQSLEFQDNSQVASNLTTYVTPLGTRYVEWADDAAIDGNLEQAGNVTCDDYAQGTFPFDVPRIPLTFTAGTGISGGSSFNEPTGVTQSTTTGTTTTGTTTTGTTTGTTTTGTTTTGSTTTGTTTTATTTPPLPCTLEASEITNQEQASFTVGTSPETITVPAGTFQTWRVSSTSNYVTEGTSANETGWWAPQIGSFVQRQVILQNNTDGSVSTLLYQMVGYKIIQATVYDRLKKKP